MIRLISRLTAVGIACITLLSASAIVHADGSATASSHRVAVVELIDIMKLEDTLVNSSKTMIDAQVQANPSMAAYRVTMLQWLERYVTWEEFEPEYIRLYMEVFSESELRQLVAFYQSPVGKKSLTEMPKLLAEGAQIGLQVAQKYQPQLREMMELRRAELEAAQMQAEP